MGKTKRSRAKQAEAPASSTPPQTTSTIKADPTLGYKIRVLIHDLRNIAKDPSSARRLNATIDEHYISVPYFTATEAETIKQATVDVEIGSHLVPGGENTPTFGKSLDEAIRMLLGNFLEKRRASGDSRPCGPHDLAPVYAALFGIELDEMQDDKFLGRLRRNGV